MNTNAGAADAAAAAGDDCDLVFVSSDGCVSTDRRGNSSLDAISESC